MTVNTAPLLRAIYWLQAGWYYFSANMLIWCALSLLFFISMGILLIIPRIGIFILVLLFPVFFAGLLYSVYRSRCEMPPRVEDIVYGFSKPLHRRSLLRLGALMLIYLFALVLSFYPLSGALFQYFYNIYGSEQQNLMQLKLIAEQFVQKHPLILWLQLLSVITGIAAFSYAIPLTLFERMSPLKAIMLSIQAFLHNLLPVCMLVGLSTILMGLATLAFGLGFLIVLPVLAGANYASYREMFSAETENNMAAA